MNSSSARLLRARRALRALRSHFGGKESGVGADGGVEDGADFGEHGVDGGLGQEGHGVGFDAVADDGFLGVAGHVEDFDAGASGGDVLDDLGRRSFRA